MTTPASTPQYRRGAEASVMPKVSSAITPSTRLTLNRRTKAWGLSTPSTAASTMADSTDCGTWASTGVSTSSASRITTTEMTVAQPVCAPAYRFRAERENDELVGKAPDSADASLPRPWPIKSWSWSQRWPLRSLSTLALDAVSKKLTRVMTSVGSTNCLRLSQSRPCGRYSAGSPCGSAPTTDTPCACRPQAQLRPAAPSTTTSTVGKVGLKRLVSTSTARLPRP